MKEIKKKIILGQCFGNKQLLLNEKDLNRFYRYDLNAKTSSKDKSISLILKKKGLYRIIKTCTIIDRNYDWSIKDLPKFYLPLNLFNQTKFRRSKLLKTKKSLYLKYFYLGPFSKKKKKIGLLKTYSFSKYLNEYEKNQSLFNKFIRVLMRKGKLNASQKAIEECCKIIWFKHRINPSLFFTYALNSLRPLVEVEKKGKKNFSNKKPKTILISSQKGYKMSIDWILKGASERKERSFGYRIYLELFDACLEKGYAYKQKQELYKLCKKTIYSRDI